MINITAKQKTEKGLAIGAVLLTLTLLAIIVAAMASTSSQSDKIRERGQYQSLATAIMNQATDIANHVDLARNSYMITDTIVLTNDDPCPANEFCLYHATDGLMNEPTPPPSAVTSINVATRFGVWIINDLEVVFPDADLGTNARENVLLMKGVDENVCRFVNSMLYNIRFDDNENPLPRDDNTDLTADAEDYLELVGDTESYMSKGCTRTAGDPNQPNFYYQVLEVN